MSLYTSVILMVLLALGVLSILIYENHRISLRKKRLFFVTNILVAAAALAECAGRHIGLNPDIPEWVLVMVKAIDYTLTPATGGCLIALMLRKERKKILFAVCMAFVANALFQIISALNGWMVIVAPDNTYTHGPLYPIYMVFYCAIIIILLIILIFYGRYFKKQNRISLYAIIIFILAGIALQEIIGNDCKVAYIGLSFGAAYFYIHYCEFAQLEMDETISEQKVLINQDALTGVYSRFAYIDDMKQLNEKIPEDLAVFVIDINGLKHTNDTLGHEAGDEIICGAASCISSTVGKDNKTYRIGGDEFVVFAHMNVDQAEGVLKQLEEVTAGWMGVKAKNLSVSAGYALKINNHKLTVELLVKEADKAMYVEKNKYYERNHIDKRRY